MGHKQCHVSSPHPGFQSPPPGWLMTLLGNREALNLWICHDWILETGGKMIQDIDKRNQLVTGPPDLQKKTSTIFIPKKRCPWFFLPSIHFEHPPVFHPPQKNHLCRTDFFVHPTLSPTRSVWCVGDIRFPESNKSWLASEVGWWVVNFWQFDILDLLITNKNQQKNRLDNKQKMWEKTHHKSHDFS